MPKKRNDINNADVLKYLETNEYSIAELARKFGCSTALIRSIQNGVRKKVKKVKHIKKEDRCVRCHIRKKGDGLKYFCDICFRRVSNDLEYSISIRN